MSDIRRVSRVTSRPAWIACVQGRARACRAFLKVKKVHSLVLELNMFYFVFFFFFCFSVSHKQDHTWCKRETRKRKAALLWKRVQKFRSPKSSHNTKSNHTFVDPSEATLHHVKTSNFRRLLHWWHDEPFSLSIFTFCKQGYTETVSANWSTESAVTGRSRASHATKTKCNPDLSTNINWVTRLVGLTRKSHHVARQAKVWHWWGSMKYKTKYNSQAVAALSKVHVLNKLGQELVNNAIWERFTINRDQTQRTLNFTCAKRKHEDWRHNDIMLEDKTLPPEVSKISHVRTIPTETLNYVKFGQRVCGTETIHKQNVMHGVMRVFYELDVRQSRHHGDTKKKGCAGGWPLYSSSQLRSKKQNKYIKINAFLPLGGV